MNSRREVIAKAIEALIDLLDMLDLDCDAEDDGCDEMETDEDLVPTTLNRVTSDTRAA